MSLNPSNLMVPPNYTRFPNMAGRQDCDSFLLHELTTAGIEVVPFNCPHRSEVPYRVIGQLGLWSFKRAWYYWIAEGPGIPLELAEPLHEQHGQVVRVNGDCGCPSPRERFKGFAIGYYHVDAQEGLNALADAIRKIIISNGFTGVG